MNDGRVAAYLRRIGAAHPAVADARALRELQVRHLHAVPFENLSIHLGEEIVLTDEAVFEQVVDRGRGGICYQLNGAFAGLLRGLGYTVTLLGGRVVADGGPGLPYDHLALLVTGAGLTEPWLADVGFGDHALHPLRYDSREEQEDPAGVFRLVETAEGDLEVLRDGKPQLVVEQRPRLLADFEVTCWYHRTSPLSHFTRSCRCARGSPPRAASRSADGS